MSELQQVDFIFTSHGTVLYVTDEGELRHGRASPCRAQNVRLVQEEASARLFHIRSGINHAIACGPSGCWSSLNHAKTDSCEISESLSVVAGVGSNFGLLRQGRYFSALPDGSLTVTAPHLKEWETFREAKVELASKPRVAGLTMVFNEPVFLPIWERYYAEHLGYENLFLIDHGTNDGSTQHSQIPNKINLPRDSFDEYKRKDFVSRLQASLLNYYDAVLFTDVDEILVADPDHYKGILDYCSRGLDRFVTSVGLEVLHFPEMEGNIDVSLPILSQRKYVRFSANYSKPLLAEIPLNWGPGFHFCQFPARVDPLLFLFHLKLVDRNLALRQLSKFRQISWSKASLSRGHGFQWRLNDDEFLASQYPQLPECQGNSASDAFIFDDELKALSAEGSRLNGNFKGKPKKLAERFRCVIPGSLQRREMQSKRSTSSSECHDLDILERDIVVVDIGAAGGLKQSWTGFEDRIVGVLFEPNPDRASEIRNKSTKFKKIIVEETALGSTEGKRSLNLAKSSGCSSFLFANNEFLSTYSVAEAFDTTHKVDVEVRSYIELFEEGRVPIPDVIKIDVQGFEYEVLSGFGDLLGHVLAVELEAHFYPIYRGQRLFHDIVLLLRRFGLILRKLAPVNHFDGDLVEVDAWFTLRRDFAEAEPLARREKLALVHREWGLPEQRRQFSPGTRW